MKFFWDLLSHKFDFIVPLYYIILGIILGIIIFIVRFAVYIKRKKYYSKNPK
jgi:hypothetical protein